MKQFIFLIYQNNNKDAQEVIIEATGMLDALKKIRLYKSKLEAETFSRVEIQFKGIAYSESLL